MCMFGEESSRREEQLQKPCSRSMIAVGGTGRKPAELEQDKPEENKNRDKFR